MQRHGPRTAFRDHLTNVIARRPPVRIVFATFSSRQEAMTCMVGMPLTHAGDAKGFANEFSGMRCSFYSVLKKLRKRHVKNMGAIEPLH